MHANSKHYFPKEAEFLSNDMINKPGTKFSSNKNAVLIKDEDITQTDPMLVEVNELSRSSART